ncbi:hypothetical protein EPUL_001698, partial [Erysiphe pulchra]
MDNACLSKEIIEIIAARHRQERAWHVRLSICARIYSNIDSTLSIYTEDCEREEAELIRNAPKPPKIPIASKPNRTNSSNKTIVTNWNKPLVATPKNITCPNSQYVQAEVAEPPRYQKQQEKSWMMITRNDLNNRGLYHQ